MEREEEISKMETIAIIITRGLELFGSLLVLGVVSSVLFGFDIMTSILSFINTNPLIVLGLGITYILYRSELEERGHYE